ncbi:RNA chaperone Hfq [Bacillus cereus]|uniref:Uncharacterized protein n=1 Tax=Bacillus cereus VD184 TaxID=1053242 RepID=A0A9W5VPJ5_BACCE|nr:RNA chaperone Hfq [Bacillus cereus]EOQ01567.1 hypothetical protein IKC_06477 [Bacillus cereus VD184]
MLLYFDIILQYVEHQEITCKFILSSDKSVIGKVVGREQYMIYVDTEKRNHFIPKHAIVDVIPEKKLDLKEVKEEVLAYNREQKEKKQMQRT